MVRLSIAMVADNNVCRTIVINEHGQGITIAAALVSAFTQTPVRVDVGLTGEVTLRGHVLPVGGIKEKVLAAYRAGIREVILPNENEKDLEEIPQDVRDEMVFRLVGHMDEVLSRALVGEVNSEVPSAAGDTEAEGDSALPH